MKSELAIDIIKNEKECVYRANMCGRDCANCDLVLPDSQIIDAYDTAINALSILPKIRNEITDLQTYICYTGDEKKIELDKVLEIIDYYTGDKDG